MPAVLNAANEIAVEAFLEGKMKFTDIPKTIEKVMSKHRVIKEPSLDDLLAADHWARQEASSCHPERSEGSAFSAKGRIRLWRKR